MRQLDGHYPTIGLSLDCGLLAASLSSFAYAVLKHRESRKYEQYHLTDEVKRAEPGIFMAGAAGGGRITGIVKPYDRDSASYRYDYARTVESEDRRVSGGGGAKWDTSCESQTGHLSSEQHGWVASGRTGVTVREISPSGTGLKREIDRAPSGELGWTAGGQVGSDVSPSSSMTGRSGSVVRNAGVVHMALPEIHVSRQQSWRTEVIAEEGEDAGRRREGDRDGLLR